MTTLDPLDPTVQWWILLDEWMFRHGDECDCPKAAHHTPLCHVTPIYASVCGDLQYNPRWINNEIRERQWHFN